MREPLFIILQEVKLDCFIVGYVLSAYLYFKKHLLPLKERQQTNMKDGTKFTDA